MKRIKFGPEMGYKKCSVCDCHFFKVDKTYCECCGFRLRSTVRRRKATTKEKAEKFLMEISNI